MRQPWRWYVLASIAVLGACDDDDEGGAQSRVQLIAGDVCPNEEVTVLVDGTGYYGGPADALLTGTVSVPAGNRQVKVFVGGAPVLDAKVNLGENKTVKLDLDRTVECPGGDGSDGDVGDGDGGDGGDGEDGSDGDGGTDGSDGTDGGVVELLPACTGDDNALEDAQAIVAGSYDDAICGADDVDFFKFTVGEDKLATITLSTGEGWPLNGEITLFDKDGTELDVQVQNGLDAVTRFLLFSNETYYVKVADLALPDEPVEGDAGADAAMPDAGVEGRGYKLTLALDESSASVEASAGTFHGTTNNPTQPGLDGSYVATSVHGEGNSEVGFKTLVRVRLPGAATQQFVFDPAAADDGVLRVVFYDGLEQVGRRHVKALGLERLPFAGWYARPVLGARLRAGFTGAVRVTFPTESFTREVTAANALAVPTVTSATATGTTLAVVSTRPEGASVVEAIAHGTENAARGTATPTTANFNITLSAAFDAGEAFVVHLTAASDGLLTLPLPEVSNVSEFIYYSDED